MANKIRLINLIKGVGKPSESQLIIDELKQIYQKYGSLFLPVKASLSNFSQQAKPTFYNLKVNWNTTNFDSLEKVTASIDYLIILDEDGNVVQSVKQNLNVTNELTSNLSLDGKLKAIVREKTKDGRTNRIIEIWTDKGLKTINGEKEKSFGKIHLNANYGQVIWSPDGSQLLFVAEQFKSTSGYFSDEKKDDKSDGGDKSDEESELLIKLSGQGEEYLIKDKWGEQLEGIGHSIACIVDLNDDYKIRTIELPGFSVKEPFWIDDKTIGFVGLAEESRRLGLIFCPIRRSYLYKCDLRDPESEPIVIYGEKREISIRSPRASYDGKKIVFLCNPACGPHFQASELVVLDLQTSQDTVLIPIRDDEINEIENPTEIKTLYALSLPQTCWTSDNKKLIIVAEMGYRTHLFVVNSESGQSQRIVVPGKAVSVATFRDDLIAVNITEPNIGCNLHIGRLIDNQVNLIPVDPSLRVDLDDLAYNCDILEETDPTTGSRQIISSILLSPKELLGKPSPTILMPHGGPHSSFIASFMARFAAIVEIGFKLLLVNYRGSTGLSSRHEKFLPGKIGVADVADCIRVLQHNIKTQQVDPKSVFLTGGSHGGFLVTHLIGQHPEFKWRACAARNPVVDVAAGLATSDIPDWHLVEGLGQLNSYSYTTIPSAELLKELLDKSPIIHIDKVKTPVIMCLGTKDKRVAMCQGLNYYYGLKARGVPTKCFVYEDNHSISKVPHDMDMEINTMLWFFDNFSDNNTV